MSDLKKYNKPALKISELAALLIERGLKEISQSELERILSIVSYYRLRGYTYPYQTSNDDTDCFVPGTCWAQIWSDYQFDIELRSVVLKGIEQIEIAFRNVMIQNMSAEYGGHWYLNHELFDDQQLFVNDLNTLQSNWNRSCEIFKKHYETNYDRKEMPPAWMIFETATFGVISKYYSNIRFLNAKGNIAEAFGFSKRSSDILENWFRNMNLVRNICAHGGRLFSRKLTPELIFPKREIAPWVSEWCASNRCYASICVICYMLIHTVHNKQICKEICNLIFYASDMQKQNLGVCEHWLDEPLFKLIFE